jgi:hypothetical protein
MSAFENTFRLGVKAGLDMGAKTLRLYLERFDGDLSRADALLLAEKLEEGVSEDLFARFFEEAKKVDLK